MGIFLGLMAAVFWGSSDFLTRGVTRAIGTYRTLLYMQCIGLVGVSLYMLAIGEFARVDSAPLSAWGFLVATMLINLVGTFGLYRALQTGVLAVVSPIAASYSAVTVLLAFLSGETLTAAHFAGVVIVMAGGVLASLEQPPTPRAFWSASAPRRGFHLPRGVAPALLAAAAYGTVFWMFGVYVTPAFGGVFPVWFNRLLTPLLLLALALAVRRNIRPPVGRMWLPVIAIGLLDTSGFVASAVGMTTEQVSIVTVLSALFSAVTVVLAWVFLREPLRRIQWVGIGLIFAGITLVSI